MLTVRNSVSANHKAWRFRKSVQIGLSVCLSTIAIWSFSGQGISQAPSVLRAQEYPSQENEPPQGSDQQNVEPSTECLPGQATANPEIAQLVGNVSQTVNLVDQPAFGMSTLFEQLAPQVMAYLNPSPFPEIHAAARQAKVPIMMYHDILPEKQVFFDVTPEEFEGHLKLIREKKLTPISADQLVNHLRAGIPLPPKPILLTFDDGYEGHYTYVYPLLKKYNYPALFSIYTSKVGKQMGRSSLTWEQLREMARDSLVTIASHSVTHKVMENMSPEQLVAETQESKQILEAELGISIRYFTYPEGKYDAKTLEAVKVAGYLAAFTMNDLDERLAGESQSMLEIGRIGQSRLPEMADVAWGGPAMPALSLGFNFSSPIRRIDATIDNVPFVFIAGGKPMTIHHHTRDQVENIIAKTPAIAGVDGAFFSLEFLESNEMLGPVLSQMTGRFIPGRRGEIPLINGRPLVLIGPKSVRFVPFNNLKHNTLEGIKAEMPDVTDAFVGAGFLVENGQPQPPARFGKLFDFNAPRHRAFWGINQKGEPQIGVSSEPIGSVDLGIALAKAGFRDAVMLDSGASTSLAYKGESLVGYTPRPVPHVVGLVPPQASTAKTCPVSTAAAIVQ